MKFKISKTFKKISAFMAFTIFFMNSTTSFANSNNVSDEQKEADIIEEITGTSDINSDTYSTDEYASVADGEELVVNIPTNSNDDILLIDGDDCENNISMTLPDQVSDTDATVTDNGTIIYSNDESNVTVGVQPLIDNSGDVSFEGVRTTITINDASASKEYSFNYDLPEGSKLITAKEYLGEEFDTGEVFVVDENNEITSIIDAAWAKDANGDDIETYYIVSEGNILTQVVNFDENTAFPVVADPSVWKVLKCAAAIGAVIATAYFSVTKLVKIKNYIKALGGLRETARLVLGGALTAKEAANGCFTVLKELCYYISGAYAIKSACF